MPTDLPPRREDRPGHKAAEAIAGTGCALALMAPGMGLIVFCVSAGWRLAALLVP